MSANRSRPFGVTLLAIMAIFGGIIAIYHALQMFGILPVSLFGGEVKFFTLSWLGGIMWIIMALIWFWVFRMLWNLDPQGWLFVVVLATLNLILAIISILGATTFSEMLPSIIINGLILLYGLLPRTKEAFGMPQ